MNLLRPGLLVILLLTLLTPPLSAMALVDTGQKQIFSNDQELDSCPIASDPFSGQDGCFQGEAHSYTKLDTNGEELLDDAPEWSIVRDNNTGLYWEVKNNSDDTVDFYNPHDADNTYVWYNSNPYENGGNPGQRLESATTEDFINSLNAEAYGGFRDWRMPTINELVLLSDRSQEYAKPSINFFPHSLLGVWSATSIMEGWVHLAKVMNYYSGTTSTNLKTSSSSVRAVRGCKLKSQMIANHDGSVTDLSNNLIWFVYQGAPTTWQKALHDCNGSQVLDYGDWRLPNINELQTLIDHSHRDPAVNAELFPGITADRYWSSTTTIDWDNDYSKALTVGFNNGVVQYNDKLDELKTIYVRGGNFISNGSLEITEFSASTTSGDAPLDVTFTCRSNLGYATRNWDFNGDGIIDRVTKNSQTSCSYPAAGQYLATCTAITTDYRFRSRRSEPIKIEVKAVDLLPEVYSYYLPYYSSNSDGQWTGLGLANSEVNVATDVTIKLIGQNGEVLLVDDIRRELSINGQLSLPLQADETDKLGWIQVSASHPISGLAFVGGSYMADIPFIEKLSTELIIPHIAQDEIWDTKILICNPNDSENQIVITNYYNNTRELRTGGDISSREESRTLVVNGSANYALNELFSDAETLHGSITIRAEKPVAAFALYENRKSGGRYFAGINAVRPNH